MNPRILSFSIGLLVLLACKKEPQVEKHYICSNFIENSVDTKLLPTEDLKIIDSLFEQNSLDKINLQFSGVAVSQLSNYTYVYAEQYENGLRLFWEGAIYVFDSAGAFDEALGVNEDSIKLDTTPKMNLGGVVKVFRERLKSDPDLEGVRDDVLSECVNVEFGYFDTHLAQPGPAGSYINAWRMTLDNAGLEMILNDESGEEVYYFSGIHFTL